MDPSTFASASWYQALTLAERNALLTGTETLLPQSGIDYVRGERRLQRWRSQPPFDVDELFAQRLARDGLAEAHLSVLLGTPAEHLQARLPMPPAWLTALAEAYAGPASTFAVPQPGEEVLGLLDLLQPLIDRACSRIRREVQDLLATWPAPPFEPDTVEEILLANLPDPLLMRIGRTLVLELNVARLQDELEGETPEARFQSFVARLRRPEVAVTLLAEYPVLARQLELFLDQWTEVCCEFLRRLCADWAAIRTCFSPTEDPGVLVELSGGAGDTHRRGRSVMVARFASDLAVVYKPKSLAVDIHMQEVLAWLNDLGWEPHLRTLTMLDRGEYGWVEFVRREGCTSPDEVQRFYRRHGAYLALMYALNATDFHLENIIAAGEHPLLIDLETLFTPQFEPLEGRQADQIADRLLGTSVLQVGMLPIRLWSRDDYGGIDISGFGGSPGQLSPDRVPQLTAEGTDMMRFVRERVELPGDANRPSLNDVELSALDYAGEIVDGFEHMVRLLLQHRATLMVSGGLLDRFARDEIRVLLRSTRTYGQLLFESFHPDMLHDGLERERFFDHLWLAVVARPYMAAVIAAEEEDLRQGDIPIFTTEPDSFELRSPSDPAIRGVITATGLVQVHRRLQQLDEEDLRRQVWLIRASLATLESGRDRPVEPTYRLPDTFTVAAPGRFYAAARAVAERLVATAILGDDDATWLGLGAQGDQEWAITPLGIDLYGGIPGIALFLAYAGDLLQEPRYTDLARRGMRTVARQVELLGPEMPAVGGFEGWGGLLYTQAHLGTLWEDPALLAQAEETVELIADWIADDGEYDVARGAAGALGSLVAYYRCVPSPRVRNVAIVCGEHLLASAQAMEQGLGWLNGAYGTRPLAGYAHGAAGIAWALLELAALTGNDRYREGAREAIAYERSLYSPAAQNWPDLRASELTGADTGDEAPRFMVAWCHGAAGIGLARLRSLRHLDDPMLAGEVAAAAHTTLARGFGQTHCLCHGDLGNLEFLLEASRVMDEPAWPVECERLAARILDSIARDGWQCGGPEALELPSLMLGIAGIGYQMLRLTAPDRIPSLLCLSPPVAQAVPSVAASIS